MNNILVTGGTVFVSRFVSEYFVKKGYNVFVLNRNTKTQVEGVTLIESDRNNIKDKLRSYSFDAVLDITAYNRQDVKNLVESLSEIKDYIFLSSSAVYSKTNTNYFNEEDECGENSTWKDYGVNKYEAEKYLLENVPNAYIIRPPYLYGPYENVYREPFVFDCAKEDRVFYVPKDGKMNLQFFYVEDLCRFIEIILEKKPKEHIFNVGNEETVSINEWVKLCYKVVGKCTKLKYINYDIEQRSYFPFYDYEYNLNVSKQKSLMKDTKPLFEGLKESYEWYKHHEDAVNKKNYIKFIYENFKL